MEARMTPEGLLIPQEWLQSFVDFEIHHSDNAIVILPAKHLTARFKQTPLYRKPVPDPLWTLGEEPIEDSGLTDASVNHDQYLYHA